MVCLLVDCISGSLITCVFALRNTALTVEDLNPAQAFLLHYSPGLLLLVLCCPTPLAAVVSPWIACTTLLGKTGALLKSFLPHELE